MLFYYSVQRILSNNVLNGRGSHSEIQRHHFWFRGSEWASESIHFLFFFAILFFEKLLTVFVWVRILWILCCEDTKRRIPVAGSCVCSSDGIGTNWRVTHWMILELLMCCLLDCTTTIAASGGSLIDKTWPSQRKVAKGIKQKFVFMNTFHRSTMKFLVGTKEACACFYTGYRLSITREHNRVSMTKRPGRIFRI